MHDIQANVSNLPAFKPSKLKTGVHCDFALCSSCREAAAQFPGGGAFSDVLTPELARALLAHEEPNDVEGFRILETTNLDR